MTHGQKNLKMVYVLPRFLTGIFLLVMVSVFSPFQLSTATAAEVVDRIVAVVNDEIIVLQDVKSQLTSLQQDIETRGLSEQDKEKLLSEERENLIKYLVNRKLIVQAAREYGQEYGAGITVSEEEIDASVARVREQYNLTEEQFEEALEGQGLTMEQYRTLMEEEALYNKIEYYEVRSKIVVTKNDITQYYQEHADQYQGKTTYHLRNILIKAPAAGSDTDDSAVKAKLEKIFSEFAAGTSFGDLARKYSDSAYADEGGELGNFELSDLSQNLRTAIEPLSPGETTDALETSDGYQILYVEEIHKDSDTPLDSVYSDIENELFQQRYLEKKQAWIDDLRENAHIKIIQ
jgi:peptidyl-prolyl cis-trans isomerase SurA